MQTERNKVQINERNYGIDLLRMVLMLMVVVLHVLGKGGILDAVRLHTPNYYIAWLLEAACLCAVNCYALITGYVSCGRKYRVSPILMLSAQALLYSIGISGIFWLTAQKSFSFGTFLDTFFPISRAAYWYLSSYAGLFLLMPVLNCAVHMFSPRQSGLFLFASFIAFSAATTFFLEDPFILNRGYSTLWLAYLYLIGAFIKKHHWETHLTKKNCLLSFAASIIAAAGFRFLVAELAERSSASSGLSNLMMFYTSPTIFFAGIALFLLFRQIRPNKQMCKLIGMLSPAAFGVYLIHCHPYIFDYLGGKTAFLGESNPIRMLLGILCISLCIYLPCLLIDYLRLKLFGLLRIKERFARLDSKLQAVISSEEIT